MPSVTFRGSLLYCVCVKDVGSVLQNATTEEPQQYKLWYTNTTHYQGAASGYEEMCTNLGSVSSPLCVCVKIGKGM